MAGHGWVRNARGCAAECPRPAASRCPPVSPRPRAGVGCGFHSLPGYRSVPRRVPNVPLPGCHPWGEVPTPPRGPGGRWHRARLRGTAAWGDPLPLPRTGVRDGPARGDAAGARGAGPGCRRAAWLWPALPAPWEATGPRVGQLWARGGTGAPGRGLLGASGSWWGPRGKRWLLSQSVGG